MTREEFEELVGKLEAEAGARPQAYKLRVLLLSLLGYAYIAFVLLGLLAGVVLLIVLSASIRTLWIAGKLVVPLLALMFFILRSLWVRIPAPDGVELKLVHAKPLFNLAGEISRKIKAPKAHTILLTSDFNAGVIQIPRLGLFGWHKNYLLVGMPLMQALSPEQFRGVIAHEFGHLSGRHGHFTSWVYRIRQTWGQLMDTLESRKHWGTAFFSKFLRWYVPFLNAYTFVLARAQEYEADRSAAEIVGSRQFAEALVKIDVIGSFLDDSFWPALYKKADNQPEPPSSPFREMANAFRSDLKSENEHAWLTLAIEKKTGSDDTHPCLSDRLAALGEQGTQLVRETDTAAHSLFGDNESALCDELAKEWRNNVTASWRDRHRYAQESRRQLGVLEEKSRTEQLTIDEEWDRARFTEEFGNAESAMPLYRNVLALDENHAGAKFAIGRLTINENDSSAIALIESAMNVDHEFVIPGCELIYQYLVSKGRDREAEKYIKQALNQSESYRAATEERATISSGDSYITHDLGKEAVNKICNQLGSHSDIKEGYLVCKELEHFPEVRLYIVGVEPDSSWYKTISADDAAAMAKMLAQQLEMPGDFFVVVFNRKNREFRKRLVQVPDSQIYPRNI